MHNDELRLLLEELQKRVETTDEVDEKGRELLSRLSVDIRSLLERTGHEEQLRGSSWEIGRLEESVRHFQATHPQLTAELNRLLSILNNADLHPLGGI